MTPLARGVGQEWSRKFIGLKVFEKIIVGRLFLIFLYQQPTSKIQIGGFFKDDVFFEQGWSIWVLGLLAFCFFGRFGCLVFVGFLGF
jgi:L-asparagine transporter-like permease